MTISIEQRTLFFLVVYDTHFLPCMFFSSGKMYSIQFYHFAEWIWVTRVGGEIEALTQEEHLQNELCSGGNGIAGRSSRSRI